MEFFLLLLAMMASTARGVTNDSEVIPVPSHGACGPDNYPGFKIINGYKARRCEFPWQVYILMTWSLNSGSCGGSIIHEKWILTAAHCLIRTDRSDRPPPETIHVYSGMLDKRDHSNHHVVDKVVIDPRYEYNTLRYDAALLRLTKSIKIDKCNAPVCLNADKNVNTHLGWCKISGWGLKALHPRQVWTNDLLFTYDLILTQRECKEIYRTSASENTLCGRAGNNQNGKAMCAGDSGGALVCKERDGRYYQHGIASRYRSTNYCTMEALYTNVGEIYNWILKETE